MQVNYTSCWRSCCRICTHFHRCIGYCAPLYNNVPRVRLHSHAIRLYTSLSLSIKPIVSTHAKSPDHQFYFWNQPDYFYVVILSKSWYILCKFIKCLEGNGLIWILLSVETAAFGNPTIAKSKALCLDMTGVKHSEDMKLKNAFMKTVSGTCLNGKCCHTRMVLQWPCALTDGFCLTCSSWFLIRIFNLNCLLLKALRDYFSSFCL